MGHKQDLTPFSCWIIVGSVSEMSSVLVFSGNSRISITKNMYIPGRYEWPIKTMECHRRYKRWIANNWRGWYTFNEGEHYIKLLPNSILVFLKSLYILQCNLGNFPYWHHGIDSCASPALENSAIQQWKSDPVTSSNVLCLLLFRLDIRVPVWRRPYKVMDPAFQICCSRLFFFHALCPFKQRENMALHNFLALLALNKFWHFFHPFCYSALSSIHIKPLGRLHTVSLTPFKT